MKKQCPFCSEEIMQTAIKCKHCGEFLSQNQNFTKPNILKTKKEKVSNKQALGGCLVIIIIIVILGGCLSTCSKSNLQSPPVPKVLPVSKTKQVQQNKWYAGGSIFKANALEWQKSTYYDKLSACTGFIRILHTKRMLTSRILKEINSNGARPFASELLRGLDEAFKKHSNPDMNKRLYTNQTVAGTSLILLTYMKWLKK